MKRMATLLAVAAMGAAWGTPAVAQQQKSDSGVHVKFTGNLYLAPEIWPDIGAKDDQKVGVGLGGMFGLALVIDEMRFGLGPHLGYNVWTADYSHKSNSATRSVTFGMQDAGVEASLVSDGIAVLLGVGTSTMDAYMTLDDGSQYYYPGLNKESFPYNTVGIGFTSKRFMLGIAHTSYKGGAKDARRLEIRLSVGR